MFDNSANSGHAIRQLQNSWNFVVAGAGADTDITVTGAKLGDAVKVVSFSGGTPSVPSGTASVTAADTIQITSSTAGGTLLVTVYPKSS